MKKRIITAAVFLIIVLAAISFYSYFSRNNPGRFVTVTINDEGFPSDTVTVLKGTTVIWENKGERLHWPASNPHPLHTLYPEGGGCVGSLLDACRGLKKDETYSFKFNALGVWGVHDHLFPGNVMSVEVVDKLSSDKKEAFDKNAEVLVSDFRALDYAGQMQVIKSISQDDPARAWAYLKDAFIVNGEVRGNAHEFAHIIGNKVFEKFGLDGIKICDEAFAFGCFHGVTEKMLLSQGLKNITSIEEGCLATFPPDKSQNYTSCIHGTGHGVYSFEGGDFKKALVDCDNISENNRTYCYDGVFMENSSTQEARVFDPKNPWKFCTDLGEQYHLNCARYQSQVFLGVPGSQNSLDVVGKYCAMGPSTLLRETCFESTGYYITQGSVGRFADIIKGCNKMPGIAGKEICIIGAAKESVFQRYEAFKDTADKLCESITDPRKSECMFNVDRMIR